MEGRDGCRCGEPKSRFKEPRPGCCACIAISRGEGIAFAGAAAADDEVGADPLYFGVLVLLGRSNGDSAEPLPLLLLLELPEPRCCAGFSFGDGAPASARMRLFSADRAICEGVGSRRGTSRGSSVACTGSRTRIGDTARSASSSSIRAEREEDSSADRPGDAARGLGFGGVVSVSGEDPDRPSAGESVGESTGMAVGRFAGVDAGSVGGDGADAGDGDDAGDCTLTAPCGCDWLGELKRSGGEGSYSFVPGGGGDAISYVHAEEGLVRVPARGKPGGPEGGGGEAIAEPRTVSAAS